MEREKVFIQQVARMLKDNPALDIIPCDMQSISWHLQKLLQNGIAKHGDAALKQELLATSNCALNTTDDLLTGRRTFKMLQK